MIMKGLNMNTLQQKERNDDNVYNELVLYSITEGAILLSVLILFFIFGLIFHYEATIHYIKLFTSGFVNGFLTCILTK